MYKNNFVVSDHSNIDSLKSALSRSFTQLTETTEKMRFDCYDTFDWRLYHNGWELIRIGNRFKIIRASTGQVISEIDVNGKKERRFSWDFPASGFADHLKPILEMRALIPMAGIVKKIDRIAVCNEDDKTVARIELESLAMAGKDRRVIHCRLLPVKGYGKDSQRIRSILKQQHSPRATASAVVDLLRRTGIHPGVYSSKVNVALQPEMASSAAVRLILENLVSVMHQNLEGVREDIDTEFLHDLRVAIRRGRSLLGQTKGVFDGESTARLQTHLKTMGGVSGQVRDLDVYLLKKEAYIKKVPEALRPGILQLFRTLQRKRRSARNHMLKLMDGADFKDALTALDHFIQSEPIVHVGTASIAPVGELAKSVIYRRFRRIIRKGSRIAADTPDEKLHELRIDCKKLRYLLEFFSSLFPADQMKILIKQLKGLQENLGDFNDLSVQQEFLAGYLAAIKPQTSQSVSQAAAIGGLIARLFADQQQVRSEFLGVFEVFGSNENQAAFKTLFT